MRAYSEDLRKKIVAAIERGMPKAHAARLFDVSLSSVKRYARSVRQGDSLTPKKSPGRPRKVNGSAQVLLEEDVKGRPAATIGQRRRFLEHPDALRFAVGATDEATVIDPGDVEALGAALEVHG